VEGRLYFRKTRQSHQPPLYTKRRNQTGGQAQTKLNIVMEARTALRTGSLPRK
jgi:hypothetical protein